MIVAGIDAVAKLSPAVCEGDSSKAILPSFSRDVSAKVATAVAMQAFKEDTAREDAIKGKKEDEVMEFIRSKMWQPRYKELVYEPTA